jgi:hypothetical protein
MDRRNVIGGDMPATRGPRRARERRARFTRPPRSSVGMTERCQVGQVFPVSRLSRTRFTGRWW